MTNYTKLTKNFVFLSCQKSPKITKKRNFILSYVGNFSLIIFFLCCPKVKQIAKKTKKICTVQKKALPLQPQMRKVPYIAAQEHLQGIGPLAQLNRVSDYGSEGCRFESCMGHKQNQNDIFKFTCECRFIFVCNPPMGGLKDVLDNYLECVIFYKTMQH